MARRKKEPQSIHRKNIATAAEQLFMKKGMDQEYNNIVNGLINEIEENIEKEMKP